MENCNQGVRFRPPPADLEAILAQSEFKPWAKDEQGFLFQGDVHKLSGRKHGRGVCLVNDDLLIGFWRDGQYHGEVLGIF